MVFVFHCETVFLFVCFISEWRKLLSNHVWITACLVCIQSNYAFTTKWLHVNIIYKDFIVDFIVSSVCSHQLVCTCNPLDRSLCEFDPGFCFIEMNPPPSSRIRIRKHSSTVITNFTSFVYCCAKVLESFVSSLCLFACLCILIRPSMCFCVSTSFAHNFIIAFFIYSTNYVQKWTHA